MTYYSNKKSEYCTSCYDSSKSTSGVYKSTKKSSGGACRGTCIRYGVCTCR